MGKPVTEMTIVEVQVEWARLDAYFESCKQNNSIAGRDSTVRYRECVSRLARE